MANRRQVLQLGTGLSALAFLPEGFAAAMAARSPGQGVYRILADSRFAGSYGHAGRLAQSVGGSTGMLELDGDITRFWRDDLSRVWHETPRALAGVTGASVLFCLEQLARDHRLRVQWREVLGQGQDDEPAEALVAWLIGPA